MNKRRYSSQELVDITAECIRKTKLALLLDDGNKSDWVPESEVVDNDNGTFSMPYWLAKDKGFI